MDHRETIEIKDLKTGYKSKSGESVITDHINTALYGGELTCLLGPNGAGKSTLLKTLTAFIPPINGEISIFSRPLHEYTETELAKVISVVLTEKPNVSNMTTEQLVALGRSPYTGFWGKLTDDDREIIDNAISMVGINNLRGKMVNTLSDGERQKAMIAKSLAQMTPIIFLDEPTAFLDYPSKVEIMLLLRKLAQEHGKTIFLSTHDLEIALQIADKIWILDKINGLATGTPEQLASNGEIGKYFNRKGVTFDPKTHQFRISDL